MATIQTNHAACAKKAGIDDQVPAFVESGVPSTAFRRNWARLIQKVYQIDPLLCSKCQGSMKVISFIEDDALIKKRMMHLGLWEARNHDPAQVDGAYPPPPLKQNLPTITHTSNYRPSIIGPNKGLLLMADIFPGGHTGTATA